MSQLFQGLLWEPVFPPTPVLDDDFNAFNITRFEDDFNRTDPAPWVNLTPGTLTIEDGELKQTNTTGAASALNAGYTATASEVVEGRWYKVTSLVGEIDGAVGVYLSVHDTGGQITNSLPSKTEGQTAEFYYQATAGDQQFRIIGDGVNINGFVKADNFLIEEVPALDGWTGEVGAALSVVNQEMVATNTAGSGQAQTIVPVTIGKDYLVGGDWTAFAGGGTEVRVRLGTLASQNEYQNILLSSVGTWLASVTPTDASLYIRLDQNDVTVGSTRTYDNITVQEDSAIPEDGEIIGFGGVKFKENSVAVPPLHDRGLPFDDSFILAVDAVNPVDYVYQGLPFTALGRIAVDLVGPVDRVAPGNVPLSAAGRLVFSAGPVAVAVAGVNYAADESVVGIPS